MLKVAFHTLGCKTNHYETDALCLAFRQDGFAQVPFHEKADVYVLNTCTVTGEADRKSRQLLRRAKRKNPDALVVALGCAVELGLEEKSIDIALGSRDKREALQAVKRHLSPSQPNGSCIDTAARQKKDDGYVEYGSVAEQSETRAYIKIEDGCDQRCSYCAIPLARGPVRSRMQANILREAQDLAWAGYREIVLTGIHLCSYGKDRRDDPHALLHLAAKLADIDGITRIRLGSLEPHAITTQWIALARKNPKLCPHFHLSLQSGSDSVLGRMRRRYTTAQFRQAVTELRAAFEDPAITTDLMVGFPGESEKEHAESLAFCREMAFSRMHVFRFSVRQGTAAAAMADPVAKATMQTRAAAMQRLSDKMASDFHTKLTGRSHQVIVENIDAQGMGKGYSERYIPVQIEMSAVVAIKPGDEVTAKHCRATSEGLTCSGAICLHT